MSTVNGQDRSRNISLPNGMANLLRANPDAARRLPQDGNQFELNELDAEVLRVSQQLIHADILVEVVSRTKDPSDYRINPNYDIETWIQTNLDELHVLPCDHRGFRKRREDVFQCLQPESICSKKFDRETVEDAYEIGGGR